ncbi:DUF5691 domain-containing protein [Massilia sp. CF038]|uniref:DUF5691 domain-containing protein n=1 Tax=Massilia sp. CF038 TaxID=1881045 RepID=UPI0009233211|nr:DUF5691 domain-containing protein [Massilia sp. CF038]SHG46708.1 hypothetical protein SAMN05428948_0611 [Massilia sp. CF038]
MNLPPALLKTLLAGTARAPVATDSVGAALQTVLACAPPEMLIWHSVAATDLWQRAGQSPAQTAPQASCEPEATCPRAAEQVLHLILRGIHPEQLDQWLATAARMGYRLPHASLVPLLEKVTPRHALQAQVAALMGKRGHWLAAQNPAWATLCSAPEQSSAALWQTGALAQRCKALVDMRRADPAAALAALVQEWVQEPADNRIALLPCLATALSLDDEAFLERALDDKRKEVRQSAQQLLAALPGTGFEQRALARLHAALRVDAGTLHITLPDTRDGAMQRDGIGMEKHHGMGEKAGWLLDMVQQVTPRHWSAQWQATPAQVIALMAASEFKTAMLTGLTRAAARMIGHDTSADARDWFMTLILQDDPARTQVHTVHLLTPQLACLPPEQQDQILAQWIAQRAWGHAVNWAATRSEALSAPLSRSLLAAVQRDMAALTTHDYSMRANLKALGSVLDADDTAYATAGWPASDWPAWPHYREVVDEMMDTLQFRHTMQRSFLESKP